MSGRRLLTFVTGNQNKLEEVKSIIGSCIPWNLISEDVDLPELQGEPEDIVKDKCKLAMEKINGPLIVEDTCLCFNALNGLPGPYIKWFLKKLGHDGLNKILGAFDDKSAYALCTFAFSSGPGQPIETFQGRTDGIIVQARGPQNFGWDPIFQPQNFEETYAEMSKSVKNSISHRSKALEKLKDYLTTLNEDQPPDSKKTRLEEQQSV